MLNTEMNVSENIEQCGQQLLNAVFINPYWLFIFSLCMSRPLKILVSGFSEICYNVIVKNIVKG